MGDNEDDGRSSFEQPLTPYERDGGTPAPVSDGFGGGYSDGDGGGPAWGPWVGGHGAGSRV